MAIKAISQFDAATPASNDKILFEQNGEGKSATLVELPISTKTQTALDTKVNTSDVLSFNEILAATSVADLTGKVAGADSIKIFQFRGIHNILKVFGESKDQTSVTFSNIPIAFRNSGIIIGNANGAPFLRYCTLFLNGSANPAEQGINEGTITSTDNGNGTANITISPVTNWGYFNLIVFY